MRARTADGAAVGSVERLSARRGRRALHGRWRRVAGTAGHRWRPGGRTAPGRRPARGRRAARRHPPGGDRLGCALGDSPGDGPGRRPDRGRRRRGRRRGLGRRPLAPLGLSTGVEPQRGQIVHLSVPGADTGRWPSVLPAGPLLPRRLRGRPGGGRRHPGDRQRLRPPHHRGRPAPVLGDALAVAPGLATRRCWRRGWACARSPVAGSGARCGPDEGGSRDGAARPQTIVPAPASRGPLAHRQLDLDAPAHGAPSGDPPGHRGRQRPAVRCRAARRTRAPQASLRGVGRTVSPGISPASRTPRGARPRRCPDRRRRGCSTARRRTRPSCRRRRGPPRSARP